MMRRSSKRSTKCQRLVYTVVQPDRGKRGHPGSVAKRNVRGEEARGLDLASLSEDWGV